MVTQWHVETEGYRRLLWSTTADCATHLIIRQFLKLWAVLDRIEVR